MSCLQSMLTKSSPVYNELVLLQAPAEAVSHWERTITPMFSRGGYKLTERQPWSATYSKKSTPFAHYVAAVILFPIGLIALFFQNESALFVNFETYGSGTMVKVSGNAPKSVRRWLDDLTARVNWRAQSAAERNLAVSPPRAVDQT